jgi:hypothetical protein
MRKSVLFVCYGNACRSIMAEALARHHWGEKLEVASAGVSALGYIPEETINVLDEVGVSTDGLYSKGLSAVDIDGFHLILDLVLYPLEGMISPSFEGNLACEGSLHGRSGFFQADEKRHRVAGYREAFRVARWRVRKIRVEDKRRGDPPASPEGEADGGLARRNGETEREKLLGTKH